MLCFYPTQSLSCPPGPCVMLCNAGCSGLCVQDAVWISFQTSLWPFRQAVYSFLLLFWTLIFPKKPFQRKLREKETPWEMAVMASVFSAPALQQPLEWWKLPDQWKYWLGYRLQGVEMSATFFYISSSPSHISGDYPRSYRPRCAAVAIGEVYHWFSSFSEM